MNVEQSNARFGNLMQSNKHTKHAMEVNKSWWRERLKHQFGFDVWQLPVCGRCEGYALWHKDAEGNPVGYCQCGHTTKEPITVEQYYTNGHHIDRSIHADAPVIQDRRILLSRDII